MPLPAYVGLALGNCCLSWKDQLAGGGSASILLHVVYNNWLGGWAYRAAARGMGIGTGGVMIAVLISQAGRRKRRFAEPGLEYSAFRRASAKRCSGSAGRRLQIRRTDQFLARADRPVRQLLVLSEYWILRNNLNSPVSPRLKQAWKRDRRARRDRAHPA
jgi:hypothetical protein